jgi:outer membrane protein TolC
MKTTLLLSLCAAGLALADAPVPQSAQTDVTTEFLTARRQVSLKEALALAAKNNTDLRAAEAQADQVSAKAGLVLSAFLPELKVTGSFVHTSTPQSFDPGLFTNAVAGPLAALAKGIDYSKLSPADLAALQPGDPAKPIDLVAANSLYGFGTVSQIIFSPAFFLAPAAGESAKAAHLGAQEAKEQVLLGVARVYLGLEGIEALEAAARDAEAVALKRERDAKAQLGVGTTTEIALLRAQSETAQARSLLATLSGQRVALLAMLEALCGEPIGPVKGAVTRLDIEASPDASEPWEASFATKAQAMGLKSQERFNTYDRLSWMPTLMVQGKASYNSNSGFAGKNWTFDAIVGAEWTLYDRGQRYAAWHENDAKTVELKARLDGARAKARAQWIGAKTNVRAAQVSLEQAQAQAQLATRAQKQADSAYQAGLTTALEVSDIDNKRFLAASSAAQARAQLEVRKVELAAAEGRLGQVMGLDAVEPK